jgi:arylsulfatase A-like enzyme
VLVAGAVAAIASIGFALRPAPPGRDLLAPPAATASAAASAEAPNLLVIVLDTLRADHVGAYGYARPTTPFLDAFAERATLFEQAISSSAFTLPSHATLFTGLFPASHGADVVEGDAGPSLAELGRLEDRAVSRPLSADARTLAEVARDGGLETGAVCANSAYLFRYFGMDQGFDTYVDPPGVIADGRPAGLSLAHLLLSGVWRVQRLLDSNERYYLLGSEINRLALEWLEPRRDRRFFLFLNYMDPHEPYLPIGEFRGAFPRAWDRQQVDRGAVRRREREILPEEADALRDAYDAEIRYVDDQLAELFARLEAWGLLDKTVVAILGDHGESFGEHHEIGHCNNVYQPEIRVPLLVREPGQTEARRVARFVHLVDVMPTLLDLARLPRPDGLQGASLFESARPLPPVAFMGRYADLVRASPRFYDRTHHAVYRDPWKLVAHSDGGRELYDVRADPTEQSDVAALHPEVVAELEAELARFAALAVPRFEHDAASPSGEALERLRQLGYAD